MTIETTDDTIPSRRYPRMRELSAMFKIMEDVIEIVDENTCQYKDGWSDLRVAQEIVNMNLAPDAATPLSEKSVAKRRLELYGKLAVKADERPGRKGTTSPIWRYIYALEDRVAVLEDLLTKK